MKFKSWKVAKSFVLAGTMASLALASNVQTEEFGGIGVQIRKVQNDYQIVRVIEGSPAQKMGLKNGDILLEVDDVSLHNSTMEEVLEMMRGQAGESLELTLGTPSSEREVSVIRETLTVKQGTFQNLDLENTSYLYKNDLMQKMDAKEGAQLFVDDKKMAGAYLEAPEKKNYRIFSVEMEKDLSEHNPQFFQMHVDGFSIELPESGEFSVEWYDAKGQMILQEWKNTFSEQARVMAPKSSNAKFILVRQKDFHAGIKHSF